MKNYTTFKDFKKEALKNETVRKEYDNLEVEFDLIRLLIKKRLENEVTQAELAERIGTKQSAISRFESGTYRPTFSFLQKISHALGVKIKVTV